MSKSSNKSKKDSIPVGASGQHSNENSLRETITAAKMPSDDSRPNVPQPKKKN